ncbi:hypothetical protein CTA1_151 [Colletotrichum tanaceti]|uniref:Uncharacterized protein n=1 Tax=Colletotrichum tanaceti TaxID=1306861 RepID=A0A4U6X2X0_9PEZI|nr:hypothetical protein CTA1_151 [Colletotrichum tanaceti]
MPCARSSQQKFPNLAVVCHGLAEHDAVHVRLPDQLTIPSDTRVPHDVRRLPAQEDDNLVSRQHVPRRQPDVPGPGEERPPPVEVLHRGHVPRLPPPERVLHLRTHLRPGAAGLADVPPQPQLRLREALQQLRLPLGLPVVVPVRDADAHDVPQIPSLPDPVAEPRRLRAEAADLVDERERRAAVQLLDPVRVPGAAAPDLRDGVDEHAAQLHRLLVRGPDELSPGQGQRGGGGVKLGQPRVPDVGPLDPRLPVGRPRRQRCRRRSLARDDELAVREQVDVALYQDAPGHGPVHLVAAEAVVREALELVDVVGEVHHGEDAVARVRRLRVVVVDLQHQRRHQHREEALAVARHGPLDALEHLGRRLRRRRRRWSRRSDWSAAVSELVPAPPGEDALEEAVGRGLEAAQHLEEGHRQRQAPLGLDRRVVVVRPVEEDEEPPQLGVLDRRAAAEHVDLGADGELLDDPEPRPVRPLAESAEGAEGARHPPQEGDVGVGPDDVGVPQLPDQGAHGAEVGEEQVAVVGREARPDRDAGRGGVNAAHHPDLAALLGVVVLVDTQLVDPDVDALGPAEVPEGELAVEAAPLDGAVDDDGASGGGLTPAVRQGGEWGRIAETVIPELGGDEVVVGGGGGFKLGRSDV